MTRVPERPALRYFGGKWILASWIIPFFPAHRTYVEPFGGAASVLLRKPRSYSEIYNDLDGELVRFFRVLQNADQCSELERRLRLTPFARDEFDLAYKQTVDPVEEARRLIIRSFMGFGANGHMVNGKTGFRSNSNRSGTTPAHDWANFPDELKTFCERLAGVVIENRDAFHVMRQHDSLETLFFLDPPYVHSTRGDVKRRRYNHEMTDGDHMKLCAAVRDLDGMVVLAGYANDIYSTELGWNFVMRDAHADGARDRTEVLWFNPIAWEKQTQMSFF